MKGLSSTPQNLLFPHRYLTMSFPPADFAFFKANQDSWQIHDNPMSETPTPSGAEASDVPNLYDMDTAQVGNLRSEQHAGVPNVCKDPWWSYPTNVVPRAQNPPLHCFGQIQYAATGNQDTSGLMLHFQGSMMAPNLTFQSQRTNPARSDGFDQVHRRRGRTSEIILAKRPQKRKRTNAETPAYAHQEWFPARDSSCEYREGTVCDEDCNSDAGSATTCCSSCSEGPPCEDPHCAIPCAQSSCEIPICAEDCPEVCPLVTGTQAQQTQVRQESIPSSERVSFLPHPDAESWDSAGAQNSPSVRAVPRNTCIDPALPASTSDSQYPQDFESSEPPTPSMVQNVASPYSPENALQTPHLMGQAPQATYSTEVSTIVGTGGMFIAPIGDWSSDDFADSDTASWMFNCPWDECNAAISNEQLWMQHLHQAHLDPQYTYGCPLQSNHCPAAIVANPLNHLQTQHGFDMNESFSCPAPTCSPAETYNDPAMLHNHFDLAHATPAQGFLYCRLNSCNNSFMDPTQLLSHIQETHELAITPPRSATNPTTQMNMGNYLPAILDNEVLVAHTCQWKLQGGSVCGETCVSEKDLQDHVKTKHLAPLSKSTGYDCQWEHCNRPAKMGKKQGFSQRGKLERHMASHTNCRCSHKCPDRRAILIRGSQML